MTEEKAPTAMRFLDGRTGHLSPFGVDRDGLYEVTDSTLALAEQYRDGGLIEFVSAEEPLPTLNPKKKKAKPAADEPDSGEVTR